MGFCTNYVENVVCDNLTLVNIVVPSYDVALRALDEV